jgi:hypothetical protein
MNGKAAFCFGMAAISAAGAVLWFNDGIKAVRGDNWADAMHYSPNGVKPDAEVPEKAKAD